MRPVGNSSRTFERKGSVDDVQDLTGRKKGAQFVYHGRALFLFFLFFPPTSLFHLPLIRKERGKKRAVKKQLAKDTENSHEKEGKKGGKRTAVSCQPQRATCLHAFLV